MWDVSKAVQFAMKNAQSGSTGQCAAFTRRAIEAGGFSLLHHKLAKDYGPSLEVIGFVKVPKDEVFNSLRKGDVVIIDGFLWHEAGHMAIYSGTNWVSDFVQSGLYPGESYRQVKPPFVVYRYPQE